MNLSESLKSRIKEKELLSRHTTFKIGGPSQLWFEPENLEDLKGIYNLTQTENIPFILIGGGSNLLVKDNGWPGMAIKLSNTYFRQISFDDGLIKIGAGGTLSNLVNFALENNLSGSEFLCGIPGTIGGALIMNAGARNVSDNHREQILSISYIVEEVTVLDKGGQTKILKRSDINFGYRYSNLNNYIILEAKIKLNKGDKEKIGATMREFWEYKQRTQELEYPSAGCVFKNPPGLSKSSGQLIEEAGFKGKKVGRAQVSSKHANFIINTGWACASEVLTLMSDIQVKIKKDYNICLKPEIKIIG